MRERLRSLAVVLVMVPVTGCSFTFVKPIENAGYEKCTTNQWAPSVDLIFAGTNAMSAVYVANQNNVNDKAGVVTVGAAVAALWLSSSIWGLVKTGECREERFGTAEDPSAPRKRVVVRRVPAAPAPLIAPVPAAAGGPANPAIPSAPSSVAAGAVAPSPPTTPAPANPSAPQRGDEEEPRSRRWK